MEDLFEMLMMVCFGLSWPVSIRKLLKSRTTKGVSVLFYCFVWCGYVCGLIGKAVKAHNGIGTPAYIWFFYTLNTIMVTCGILLYFRNRRLEKAAALSATEER